MQRKRLKVIGKSLSRLADERAAINAYNGLYFKVDGEWQGVDLNSLLAFELSKELELAVGPLKFYRKKIIGSSIFLDRSIQGGGGLYF